MAWNDLLANQMVSFTDAQGGGFTLLPGQSNVSSNQCMTKNNILTKYNIASDNFNTYANDQLVPKNVWLSDIIIGTQIWTKRNLDVETYRDGTSIPQATTDADWIAKGNAGIGAWCYYANNSANGPIYGKLYNWYAVAGLDGSGTPRNLAPLGYHVPTDAEWTILTTYLGTNAGGKMKSTGTIQAGTGLWQDPNSGATNESGFTALPGGLRTDSGGFFLLGSTSAWWSSLETDTTNAWFRDLGSSSGIASRSSANKKTGFSVRLIKD